MPALPKSIIGDAHTSTYAWEMLKELVEIEHRMAGHPGEIEGARIVEKWFRQSRLSEVELAKFPIDGWSRDSSTLRVGSRRHSKDHEIIALPGSNPDVIRGTLVDGGYGRPIDFDQDIDGQIPIIRTEDPPDENRTIHRLERYATAVNAGAAAVIFQNHVVGGLPITGEIGWVRRPSPIPGVGVSYELGERLRRNCVGDRTAVEIDVACEINPADSVIVSGELGPETNAEILVTAHVDSHDISEGARDNGVGCALLAELGRLFSSIEDRIETKIRFVAFGSEEIGLLGAHEYINTHPIDSVKCVINIDTAARTRTPRLQSYGFDSMEAVFHSVLENLTIPGDIDEQIVPNDDAWPFAREGIPAVTIGSTPDTAGRGWGHTHADTLDKIDIRDLRAQAIVIAALIFTVSRQDVTLDRVDPQSVRERVDPELISALDFLESQTNNSVNSNS